MKPNCMKCKHYFVTFDPAVPKGCRIYGIKSMAMPSTVIKQANNGMDCIGFAPKADKKEKTKNLNDDKYWKA
jgi:hypothetical protein